MSILKLPRELIQIIAYDCEALTLFDFLSFVHTCHKLRGDVLVGIKQHERKLIDKYEKSPSAKFLLSIPKNPSVDAGRRLEAFWEASRQLNILFELIPAIHDVSYASVDSRDDPFGFDIFERCYAEEFMKVHSRHISTWTESDGTRNEVETLHDASAILSFRLPSEQFYACLKLDEKQFRKYYGVRHITKNFLRASRLIAGLDEMGSIRLGATRPGFLADIYTGVEMTNEDYKYIGEEPPPSRRIAREMAKRIQQKCKTKALELLEKEKWPCADLLKDLRRVIDNVDDDNSDDD
jgi:hypothetical protein